MDGEVCLFGSRCLFVGNSAQCHEESNVNATCIVESCADKLLDSDDTVLVKTW